jgi:hypothetical protein
VAPRGEICPQGECSPLCSPPGVNALYCLEEWRGEHRLSPPGDNFTSWGQNSPLGDNFAPGGQSLPLGAKLRMGLSMGNLMIFLQEDIFDSHRLRSLKSIFKQDLWPQSSEDLHLTFIASRSLLCHNLVNGRPLLLYLISTSRLMKFRLWFTPLAD